MARNKNCDFKGKNKVRTVVLTELAESIVREIERNKPRGWLGGIFSKLIVEYFGKQTGRIL